MFVRSNTRYFINAAEISQLVTPNCSRLQPGTDYYVSEERSNLLILTTLTYSYVSYWKMTDECSNHFEPEVSTQRLVRHRYTMADVTLLGHHILIYNYQVLKCHNP